MTTARPLIRDRRTGTVHEEAVLDEGKMRWLYEHWAGRLVRQLFVGRLGSRLYAAQFDTRGSAHRIPGFIARFGIDTAAFEPGPYPTFNAFFARRFRAGVRPFDAGTAVMSAGAEGCYQAWQTIGPDQRIPVKGQDLTLSALLDDPALAESFAGGPAIVARLRPHDYHRFHFVDGGEVQRQLRIAGVLESVNPIALQAAPHVFVRNERHVTVQHSEQFGLLAYVEIGAMKVGKIIQHDDTRPRRGQEKGYFLYGGSTVVLLGQAGAWTPDADLLQWTQKGIESFVRLGEPIAGR
ncbi:MAG: phosphatidylserine decarboxylase [Candidatus Sericytochromatia bacterium]|nr:phosphatidylserine decarboxylase [Candidatus Sericytochromatia bacterium]